MVLYFYFFGKEKGGDNELPPPLTYIKLPSRNVFANFFVYYVRVSLISLASQYYMKLMLMSIIYNKALILPLL